MKLWIDDIRPAPDNSYVVARDNTSAIRSIVYFGNEIEEISIDHDISHQVGMEQVSRPFPCGETFVATAYFIGSYYAVRTSRPTIVIHTANPVGAEKIMHALGRFDYAGKVTVKMLGAANRLELEV